MAIDCTMLSSGFQIILKVIFKDSFKTQVDFFRTLKSHFYVKDFISG